MDKTLERWNNYRLANSMRPEARSNELYRIFTLLNPQMGEKIWEAGTGNGYLTFPIAQAVGSSGMVVTTDVTKSNILDVKNTNKQYAFPIKPLLLPIDDPYLHDYDNYFDAVASIATFHHYDNRREKTGERGRREALKAFAKALKPGGRMVVSDVLHDTVTQVYFDAIDNPRYCAPHGHPHDFYTKKELIAAVQSAGFTDITVNVESVPWQFSSNEEAQEFIHTIHNADCSPEESFALAKKVLGFQIKNTHRELGWELFFLIANKPR